MRKPPHLRVRRPGTSPLYGVQVPSFVLRRAGDAAGAVELYDRLAKASKRGARTRAMKALVDEEAALIGETNRYAWFELRKLMESAEGTQTPADKWARTSEGDRA